MEYVIRFDNKAGTSIQDKDLLAATLAVRSTLQKYRQGVSAREAGTPLNRGEFDLRTEFLSDRRTRFSTLEVYPGLDHGMLNDINDSLSKTIPEVTASVYQKIR